MTVKLLTEHNLEFLILKGGCTGLSESTLVKIPQFWKSHVIPGTILFAHMAILLPVRVIWFHQYSAIGSTFSPGVNESSFKNTLESRFVMT